LIRLFSPDGSHLLLFTKEGQGKWDLWTVPISLAQRKSTGPAVKIFSGMVPPSRGSTWAYLDTWSPDGSKIAFVHDWDIWMASADGKNVQQLSKTPEMEAWPIWSPDGTMIFFNSGPADKTPVGSPPEVVYQRAYIMPASGGEMKAVLRESIHVRPGPAAAWSPNGKELTVVCESEGELAIVNCPIDGGAPRILARLKDLGLKGIAWPRWSPDGRLLAFQGHSPTDAKFYIYHVDDASLQPLSDDYVPPFYWSPDGKWICYYTQETVKTRPEGVIWEVDVDEAVAKLSK